MNLFGNDESDDGDTSDTNGEVDAVDAEPDELEEAVEAVEDEAEDGPEMVTLVIEKEATFEYTEHEAEVTFVDGSTKTYTFDVMNKNSQEIVLKNYTDELKTRTAMRQLIAEPKGTMAFLTIERDQLRTFETVERRDKEMSKTVYNEREEAREDAEEYVEYNPDLYRIKEDMEDTDG